MPVLNLESRASYFMSATMRTFIARFNAARNIAAALLFSLPALAQADTLTYSFIFGGKNVGHLIAKTDGDATSIDFDVKNNGRGPTIAETIKLDAAVAQSSSPWADGVYARALLKTADKQLPVLPGGVLRLEKGETLSVQGTPGPIEVTRYDLIGINLDPDTILLDANGNLFALVDSTAILVRAGYEGEEQRLRKLAAVWSTQRFINIERETAHHYAGPIRIRNVRIFDPKTSTLTQSVAVVVKDKVIAAVEPVDSPPTPGEVIIDGAGGTLLAGMYEMHAHLNQEGARVSWASASPDTSRRSRTPTP
jgi:hypothetical protein